MRQKEVKKKKILQFEKSKYLLKNNFAFKGYLRYKTITSQIVLSEVQIKLFFYFAEKLCSIHKIFKRLYFRRSPDIPNLRRHDEY